MAKSIIPVVEQILDHYGAQRQNLIPILQDVQDEMGYVPEEAIRLVALRLSLSENDIFGVATFYSQFRLTPPGRHCLKLCEGTACHVRGAGQMMDTVSRKLNIAPGETTPDREFSLERVMCLGSCALAPAVVVDDTVYGRMTQKRLEKLLEERYAVPEHPTPGRD